MTLREATLERLTNETNIRVYLSLDVDPVNAPQRISVETGIGFLDHVRGACAPAYCRCCTRSPSTAACRWS